MIYKVKISQLAYYDLEHIYEYLLETSEERSIAIEYITKLENSISSLGYMPSRCRKTKKPNYRVLNVDNYRVIFFVEELKRTVKVIRVIHAKRNMF